MDKFSKMTKEELLNIKILEFNNMATMNSDQRNLDLKSQNLSRDTIKVKSWGFRLHIT